MDVMASATGPTGTTSGRCWPAAKIIAEHPQLFGLFLSNFGCGPNSIIQNIVEDIMGGKPLGQIEVDEHAAEAGYITRLEALVDTVRGYRRGGLGLVGSRAVRAPGAFGGAVGGERADRPHGGPRGAVAAAMRALRGATPGDAGVR